jgi:hypothetical protein
VQVSVAFSDQPEHRVKNRRREPNHGDFVSWTTIEAAQIRLRDKAICLQGGQCDQCGPRELTEKACGSAVLATSRRSLMTDSAAKAPAVQSIYEH